MIPSKIIDLVNQLIRKTQNNELDWSYDHEDSSVFLELPQLNLMVNLKYRFDDIYETGIFILNINLNTIDYFFDAKDGYDEYILLKNLYDSVQAYKFSQSFAGLQI